MQPFKWLARLVGYEPIDLNEFFALPKDRQIEIVDELWCPGLKARIDNLEAELYPDNHARKES